MKVLMINGSPRKNGNTQGALDEMKTIFEAEGIEVECLNVGKEIIRGCVACGSCGKLGKCVFDDDVVNEVAAKFEAAYKAILESALDGYMSSGATSWKYPPEGIALARRMLKYAGNHLLFLRDLSVPFENNGSLPPVPDDAQFLTPSA